MLISILTVREPESTSCFSLPKHHLRRPARRRGRRVPLVLGLDARAPLELDVVVENEVREHGLELVGGEEAGSGRDGEYEWMIVESGGRRGR